MISTPTTLPAPNASRDHLALLLNLALTLRARFAEVRQTATIAVQWTRLQIGWQSKMAADVRAIDDAMEAAAPLLWECLKNDAPCKRKRVWAAWQTTHARTEQRAAELTPRIPAPLLED